MAEIRSSSSTRYTWKKFPLTPFTGVSVVSESPQSTPVRPSRLGDRRVEAVRQSVTEHGEDLAAISTAPRVAVIAPVHVIAEECAEGVQVVRLKGLTDLLSQRPGVAR